MRLIDGTLLYSDRVVIGGKTFGPRKGPLVLGGVFRYPPLLPPVHILT